MTVPLMQPTPNTRLRVSARIALLATVAGCVIGFIVWPGCATPPLPAKRTQLSPLKPAEFSTVRKARPHREEVMAKLGKPDEEFSDLKVACYRLNNLTRRRLWLLFGFLPIAWPKDAPGLEVGLIRYDANGLVQDVEVKRAWGWGYAAPNQTLRFLAVDWVKELSQKGGSAKGSSR